jgi:hypothetical protein
MTAKRQANDWLYQFEEPGEPAMETLHKLTLALPITAASTKGFRTRKNAALEGTLSELLESLGKALRADYENQLNDPKRSWQFDYVVAKDMRDAESLQVLTRLFAPPDSGSILYGRLIRRVGDNRYLLWVDD